MSLPTSTARSAPPVGELARAVVSTRTGVVARFHALPRSGGDVSAHHISVRTAAFERLLGGGDIDGTGGSYYDLEGACARAVYESLERYAASFSEANGLLLAEARSGGPFLWGDKLPLYADFQYEQPGFPFRRLRDDSKIHWCEGRSLVSGKLWYAPACLIPVPFYPMTEDENLGPTTSVGMSAADSWPRACLTSLFEVCEREAFMILWMNRLSMPRLVPAPGSALEVELRTLLAGTNAKLTFVNMTSDLGVPTVLAVLERPLFGKPLVTMGASAKTTLAQAARKATLEALGCYGRVRQEYEDPRRQGWACAPDFSNVDDYVKHCLVYADPNLQHALAFLTASSVEIPLVDEVEERTDAELLLRYVRKVADQGEDVIAVTLTTRDVAALGVHVVKVLVPGAVPLNPHHLYPPLGHRRLYTAPKALGYRATESSPGELNLAYPHPFP
jgi:ribosomal protein S12 methylthiotransferase accessory factor